MVILHFHGVSIYELLVTVGAVEWFHTNMILHSSGYAAFSWALFMNFLSRWEQLNGFSSEHDASF